MSSRSIGLSEGLHRYLVDHSVRKNDILRRLRDETAPMEESGMQIAPEQGPFLAMLVRMLNARRTLEVGVFTGYSSTVVALALPEEGRITACDVSEEYTSVARRYWKEAGIDHKIDLRIGDADATLGALLDEERAGTYDFAFIDADKASYDKYYEHVIRLLRSGGVVALDNMLRHGRVLDPADENTRAIAALNEKIYRDDRVDISMVPIADGVTLARKR